MPAYANNIIHRYISLKHDDQSIKGSSPGFNRFEYFSILIIDDRRKEVDMMDVLNLNVNGVERSPDCVGICWRLNI